MLTVQKVRGNSIKVKAMMLARLAGTACRPRCAGKRRPAPGRPAAPQDPPSGAVGQWMIVNRISRPRASSTALILILGPPRDDPKADPPIGQRQGRYGASAVRARSAIAFAAVALAFSAIRSAVRAAI